MQPNKKTHEWVGWLKALVFMSLLIGLLVGSCQIPRSAASSSLAPQNSEIGHSGWRQQEPAEARDWDSNSPHRFDAAISIPTTFAKPGEDPVVLDLVQVPQELVDLWWSTALSRVNDKSS